MGWVAARRRAHRALRRHHRLLPVRHQEGAGLLDGVAARLHVHRRRRRRLLGRRLPPAHPRLLQGLPLPRLGLGDPRLPPRAGHAEDGRAEEATCRSPRWTYLVACCAIAGFPFASGFFSKDEILWKAFTSEHLALFGHPTPWLGRLIYVLGIVAATGTSFYMFRSVLHDLHRRVPRGHGPSRRARRGSARREGDRDVGRVGGDRMRRTARSTRTATRTDTRRRPTTPGTATTTRTPRTMTTPTAGTTAGRRTSRPGRSPSVLVAPRARLLRYAVPRHPDGSGRTRRRSSSTGSSRRCPRRSPFADASRTGWSSRSRASAFVAGAVGWVFALVLYKDAKSRRPGDSSRPASRRPGRSSTTSTTWTSSTQATVIRLVALDRPPFSWFDGHVIDGAREPRRRGGPVPRPHRRRHRPSTSSTAP